MEDILTAISFNVSIYLLLKALIIAILFIFFLSELWYEDSVVRVVTKRLVKIQRAL